MIAMTHPLLVPTATGVLVFLQITLGLKSKVRVAAKQTEPGNLYADLPAWRRAQLMQMGNWFSENRNSSAIDLERPEGPDGG